MIEVRYLAGATERELAFAIRYQVFVSEQHVPADEEYDEFDQGDAARHFLAWHGEQAVGTARWRFTGNGIKLERFAVLQPFRGRGVGEALVRAVLADITAQPASTGQLRYLNAQLAAMPLYAKFGFVPEGELFRECDIDHYRMVLPAALTENR